MSTLVHIIANYMTYPVHLQSSWNHIKILPVY